MKHLVSVRIVSCTRSDVALTNQLADLLRTTGAWSGVGQTLPVSATTERHTKVPVQCVNP